LLPCAGQDYCSSAIQDWFGYSPAQFQGRDALAFVHPDDLPIAAAAFTDAIQRSAAAGGAAASVHVTRRMRVADGTYVPVHTSGCMEGGRWHLVCKRLNAQEAKEKAIRSLLLSISHELRTPAQSGLAATQLLSARASVQGDAEAAFLVQAVGASCGLLLGMVSNATSMRRIEKGELDMHTSLFDPAEALASLLQVCRLGCTAAAARIDWVQSEPLPCAALADRTFFCHILQNLVRMLR
jgi:signal transduction histidine kinase